MHKPILLQDLGLSFSHKTCFENFNARILPGSRIAIIGRNGCGKSSLLTLLKNKVTPTAGVVVMANDVKVAHVPQHIDSELSGGERFKQALNEALVDCPDILLLDEPTNHLDRKNRQALLCLLRDFDGTLIIVSHDIEILRSSVDILWHIEHENIYIFNGNYDDYMHERKIMRLSLEQHKVRLNKNKKETHQALMQEQRRAAKSRAKGEKSIEQRKWVGVSKAKALRASTTSGRKKTSIQDKKQDLTKQLAQLYLPEIITPKFSLSISSVGRKNLITINNGSVAYLDQTPILVEQNFSMASDERIAICGDNGSGKSTLIKAILSDPSVIRTGDWLTPRHADIGYLDQHYSRLVETESVLDSVQKCVPEWPTLNVRRHLTDFLFFDNEEVNARVSTLSGGEKAKLCLAQIAANTPKLLILDEVTNNLDLESRAHVIAVLKLYHGAVLVISHDEDFLKEIGINNYYFRCEPGKGAADGE